MKEEMKKRILEILADALPQIDFSTSAKLVDDGILDSLSIVTIVTELSLEYDVEFDLDQLEPANLNSVDAMVDTVLSLKGNK